MLSIAGIIRRAAAFGVTGLLASGCAGPPRWNLPEDHPANPLAAEAPPPPASQTLRLAGAPVRAASGERRAVEDRAAAAEAEAEGASASGAAAYVCPHHPEVRQDSPGECPECGMELAPEAIADDGSARGGDDAETPDGGNHVAHRGHGGSDGEGESHGEGHEGHSGHGGHHE